MNIWDHIVSTGDWGAELRCTPLVFEIFRNRKIFLNRLPATPTTIKFDCGVSLEPYASFHPETSTLYSLGAFSYVQASGFSSDFKVGRYCSLAHRLKVFGAHHPIEWATTSGVTYAATNPGSEYFQTVQADFIGPEFDCEQPTNRYGAMPCIGNDVWIGMDVKIARDITIGSGAVIGAGAVVTRNIAPYMIAAGVPAHTIRPRFSESIIERLHQSNWWEYDAQIFKFCDYTKPEKFLDDFARAKQKSLLMPYVPETITFKHILNDLMDRI